VPCDVLDVPPATTVNARCLIPALTLRRTGKDLKKLGPAVIVSSNGVDLSFDVQSENLSGKVTFSEDSEQDGFIFQNKEKQPFKQPFSAQYFQVWKSVRERPEWSAFIAFMQACENVPTFDSNSTGVWHAKSVACSVVSRRIRSHVVGCANG